MVKSPNKVITSGNAPTTSNTAKGDLAFGTVDGETKLYGNTGTEVVELGGGGGSEVNVIAPLTATTIPTVIGEHSLAIGSGADSGRISIAIGDDATANYGSNLVAIGYNSDAANSSVAIGNNTLAYGNSVAVGDSANADADRNVAIGAGAFCSGTSTVAIGYNSRSDESNTFAVGSSDFTRRITHVSDPTGDQDAATKKYVDDQYTTLESQIDDKGSDITTLQGQVSTLETTVAGKADTSALNNYATKTELNAKADQTTVDSLTTTVNGKVSSITAGEGISITGTATEPVISASAPTINSIAPLEVEAAATCSSNYSVAIGDGASVTGSGSVAIGWNATGGQQSVSLGQGATTNDGMSIGFLSSSVANSVAIGKGASTTAVDSVAIGNDAIANEMNTVSFGGNESSPGETQTARLVNVSDPINAQDAATKNYVDTKIAEIPSGTTINSIAPLTVTTAPSSSSPNAVAIGLNARATASSSVAIGANAVANASNTVSFGSSSGTRRIIYVTDPANAQDAATKNYVDTQLEPINTKLQHFPETFADTGWMEITGSSGNGLKYLTGPWTIPVAAKVKIRKFGKRVTVVGVVQATEDISSDAATPLLSIPESDPHFDAFNLPQVSQYDIAHDQQKSAVTSAILVHGVLTSFNVEQNPDTPSINVTLVPVVGTAGLTAQIENGDTVNFQISWDTED